MELSKEILEALRWLDGMGYPFEAQFIKDVIPEPPEECTEKDLRENIRVRLMINKVASKFIKSRSEPMIESIDAIEELLVELDSISGEDHLNAYFTETCLEMIPNYVERIRKLVAARVEKIPSKKVENYFRQAANCYIFGLYDAVAVLSRSVLEFSIEDTLRNNSIVTKPPMGEKGYLERLIETAEKTGTIPKKYAALAHNIRIAGNKAIHRNSTNEDAAFDAIKNTAIILSVIYRKS